MAKIRQVAKLRLSTPKELAKHACEVAAEVTAELRKRGWFFVLPSQSEIEAEFKKQKDSRKKREKRRLTPANLRVICESLNDEHGTGGQSKLARLLKWQHSTVRRKLNGKSPITESDALAIQKAVELAEGR